MDDLDTKSQIKAIIARYTKSHNGHTTLVYGRVVGELSRIDGCGKSWGWRYLWNVQAGHLPPGRRFARAIDILYRRTNTPRKPRRKRYRPEIAMPTPNQWKKIMELTPLERLERLLNHPGR